MDGRFDGRADGGYAVDMERGWASAGGRGLLGMSLALFPETHLSGANGRRPLDGSAN